MNARTLLFATDYTEASQDALKYAASLARDLGATLVIAHVSDHELLPVGEAVAEVPQASREELAELEQIKPPGGGVACEYKLLFAEPTCQNIDPVEELIRFADRRKVEAIVVGTHGRTGLSRAFYGSVAEQLVRRAHCPVITVRPAAAPPAQEQGDGNVSVRQASKGGRS